jgi:sugar phosphate isomerase/epimerase
VRIGVDSYAYHRLLGEVRTGEEHAPRPPFARGYLDVAAIARELELDVLSLETNVLPPPGDLDLAALREEAGEGRELVLAHGHPEGLEFGANAWQAADLQDWIALAARARTRLVRVVAGGPRARLAQPAAGRVERTVAALRRPCELAGEGGVALALENHADLQLVEVEAVLEALDATGLGVCFDTTNWVRVGDDPAEAARRLAGRVRMVHLKDHVVRPDDGITGPSSVELGTGEVDLRAVLDAVLGADPDVPVCVELGHLGFGGDEVAIVERSVRWLRTEADRREGAVAGEER